MMKCWEKKSKFAARTELYDNDNNNNGKLYLCF